MAADTTMLPFVFVKNGKPSVSIWIRPIASVKRGDYGLEVVPMAFTGILPAVTTGKCDMACGGIALHGKKSGKCLFRGSFL